MVPLWYFKTTQKLVQGSKQLISTNILPKCLKLFIFIHQILSAMIQGKQGVLRMAPRYMKTKQSQFISVIEISKKMFLKYLCVYFDLFETIKIV